MVAAPARQLKPGARLYAALFPHPASRYYRPSLRLYLSRRIHMRLHEPDYVSVLFHRKSRMLIVSTEPHPLGDWRRCSSTNGGAAYYVALGELGRRYGIPAQRAVLPQLVRLSPTALALGPVPVAPAL